MTETDFKSLKLSAPLLQVVEELGFTELTPIQAQSIPLLLEGQDLIGQSKTGSGKTAAFVLPILQKIDLEYLQVQALILSPTRELCAQVAREVRKFGRHHPGLKVLILSGGQPGRPQKEALNKGIHIVVGTPGRVMDHMRRESLDLRRVKSVVLDEADRMLDMGFKDDIHSILSEVPTSRQTILFSATYPPTIQTISQDFQKNPARITIEEDSDEAAIRQLYCVTDQKKETLLSFLDEYKPESTLVFCNYKTSVNELEETLLKKGGCVASLHGDLDQADRDRVMAKFRNRSLSILVATDVAARGLDVENLDLVVNYEVPAQPEIYLHRIGRTGRAGKTGLAVTLVALRDKHRFKNICDVTGVQVEEAKHPDVSAPEKISLVAPMDTLYISGGRKDKMRPGDILGALTGEAGLEGSQIGKIEIHDRFAYVAVSKKVSQTALEKLKLGKIKGKKFKVEFVR